MSGLLLAITIPGLVLLLLVLAVLEHVASRLRRRSVVTGRQRPALTATGMDFMAVLTTPDKEIELEQRAQDKVRRVEQGDGRTHDRSLVDLDGGTARIVPPAQPTGR